MVIIFLSPVHLYQSCACLPFAGRNAFGVQGTSIPPDGQGDLRDR